jgi:anthranilate 1,2-dioxygenase large subunit/terephthalate 1,2-dioxygenase oxygenase component alpha subunit
MPIDRKTDAEVAWPKGDATRVPYRLYLDPSVYEAEQEKIFRGRTWTYLGLEAEIPSAGDFKATHAGETPVVLTRAEDASLHAWVNRCAHRGALVCLERFGNARALTCVYHAWSYDLKGRLRGVAFQNGVNGAGGMPPEFRREEHGLRALKVECFAGLVFGSFDHGMRPLANYLGPEIAARVKRVLPRPAKVLGYFKQVLNNNWKLYVENVKDSYHASILHLFFTTFRINRLSQSGGIVVDESGGHHVSYSKVEQRGGDADYEAAKLRADTTGFGLLDPTLLSGRDEFADAITLQILTIFPTLVLQQIQNSLVVRQVLPKGPDKMEIVWTYYGFADDDEALASMRLKQCNMVGPAGYISMEDGAVGAFVQRALPGAAAERSIVMMGGHGTESQPTRATETSVRGFWKAYRALMDV